MGTTRSKTQRILMCRDFIKAFDKVAHRYTLHVHKLQRYGTGRKTNQGMKRFFAAWLHPNVCSIDGKSYRCARW
jgi:hypothetical protein